MPPKIACSTFWSKTVEPPTSACGPGDRADAVHDRARRRRLGLRGDPRVDEPVRPVAAPHRRRHGDDSRNRRQPLRQSAGRPRRHDVHGRAEARPGERHRPLGRGAHLGAGRQLVEAAVERLHREQRRRQQQHERRAAGEERDRPPHHRRRPRRPERAAALLPRAPGQRQPEPLDARSHARRAAPGGASSRRGRRCRRR